MRRPTIAVAPKKKTGLSNHVMVIKELPDDLIIKIVSRLPVKFILRFKSVCKAWYSLFYSPIFIQHHRHIISSVSDIDNMSSFLVCSHTHREEDEEEEEEENVEEAEAEFDAVAEPAPEPEAINSRLALWSFLSHDEEEEEVQEGCVFSLVLVPFCGEPIFTNVATPFKADWNKIKVVGCINGLVCLNVSNSTATTIVIWNPATRIYSQIPDPQLLLESDDVVSLGFAYDEKTDCYKVIRKLHLMQSLLFIKYRPFKVEVYSSAVKTWTTIEVVDFPLLANHRSCGNAVHGIPYWYAYELQQEERSDHSQVLMWFDPSVDDFRFQHLPYSPKHPWCVKTGLGVKGEHPLAFAFSKRYVMHSGYITDIWKLKKCDDADSDPFYMEQLSLDFSMWGSLIGFWGNDKIIALDRQGKLVIYDPDSAEFKYLPTICLRHCYGLPEVYDYTESLVSPFMVC